MVDDTNLPRYEDTDGGARIGKPRTPMTKEQFRREKEDTRAQQDLVDRATRPPLTAKTRKRKRKK